MSEFLAEARILVRPDTTRFRAQLQEEVNRAINQARITPITVPIAFGAGRGIATAAATTAALNAAQLETAASTQRLTGLAAVENTTFAKQAVVLDAATTATLQKAGADATAAKAASANAAAQSNIRKGVIASLASFTGLRGAVLAAGSGFLAGTIAVQALAKSLGLFAGLQRDLATFRVTTGATAEQLERVSDAARQLARDATLPSVGLRDSVQAMLELSKAGLSVNESIAATRGVLQLATAAELDNAQAVDLVANALNVFQLNGEEAGHVADLLANAANAAQGSIADMGIALRQSASVAAQLGLSVDQTVGFITQLARAGLQGSDAGTTLRVALSRLVAPTERARDAIHELRLDLFDAQGDLNPDIFVQLGRALSDVSKQRQAAVLIDIFGENAQRVAAILAGQGFTAFRDVRRELEKVGTASEVAGAKTAGLSGQAEQAANEFERLGLSIGTVAAPIAGLGLEGLNISLGSLNTVLEKNIENFEETGDAIDTAAAAFADFVENNTAFGKFADETASFTQRMVDKFEDLGSRLQDLRGQFPGLGGGVAKVIPPIKGLSAAEIELAKGLRDANLGLAEQIDRMGELAQAAGAPASAVQKRATATAVAAASGDQNALLAALRVQEANQEAFLQRILARPQSQAQQELAEQAAKNLEATRSQIEGISKTQAAELERAAKDAQTALGKADQAVLDLFENRRDDAGRRVAAAAETEGVQDDIRAQNRLQALIQDQIKAVRKQVKDEETRRDAIRDLRIALIRSRQEEDALRKERAQEAGARRDETQNLNIQIAEERGNESALERAIRIRINTLNKQIKAAKGDQVKMKQLILERERLKSQLEELNKQQEEATKEGKTFAQKSFEFAQTLQGFSANLLGNLIPGFATGGLVGGSGGGGGTFSGGAGGSIIDDPSFPSRPFNVGAGVQQQGALQASIGATVKPVQVDTTNALLRQILAALQGRHTQPPEIRHNRRTGSASFDTL